MSTHRKSIARLLAERTGIPYQAALQQVIAAAETGLLPDRLDGDGILEAVARLTNPTRPPATGRAGLAHTDMVPDLLIARGQDLYTVCNMYEDRFTARVEVENDARPSRTTLRMFTYDDLEAFRPATDADIARIDELHGTIDSRPPRPLTGMPAVDRAYTHAVNAGPGVVILAGPGGSGRTEAARRVASHLGHQLVVVVNDDREYDEVFLPGAVIGPLPTFRPTTFYGAAAAVRAAAAPDPDVLIVDVVPDPDAVHAALTAAQAGCLVILVLPANTAAGALAYLHDLGIDDDLVAETVSVSIGLRLIATVCNHCYDYRPPTSDELDAIVRAGLQLPENINVRSETGCTHCQGRGRSDVRVVLADHVVPSAGESSSFADDADLLYESVAMADILHQVPAGG